MGNKDLLLDNARTPFATSVGYWRAGYNNIPSQGSGNWDGTHGLTSSVANYSANAGYDDPVIGLGKISVGYLDGAAQNDPDIGPFNDPSIGGPTLATNRTLFRPTLAGDLNLDGKVTTDDIGLIIAFGYFGKASAPHGWLDGDFNGDGKVTADDIGIIIGSGTFGHGSYGAKTAAKVAKASATLTAGEVAATTTEGHTGDGLFDYIYDPSTGDVLVHYDGDTRITVAQPLQRLKIFSAGGHLRTENLNQSGFLSSQDPTLIDAVQANGSIKDGYDLGNILPANMALSDALSDLTLQFQIQGGGTKMKAGDFVNGVPEPTTLGLIGVGAMGLLARRRKATRR